MRLFACITAVSLLGPPSVEPPEAAGSAEPAERGSPEESGIEPPTSNQEPEVAVEPASEPGESTSVDPMFADDSASLDPSAAAELQAEAAALASSGQCSEAIAAYRQAYALAPGEHLIAYAIASCALKIGDCETMRIHLAHFVQFADPAVFPQKLAKARRALDSSSCGLPTGGDPEVLEARSAGGRPVGSTSGGGQAQNGSGLVGAGS
jgi:hypothetical protein